METKTYKFVGRLDEKGDTFFTGKVYLNDVFEDYSYGVPIEETMNGLCDIDQYNYNISFEKNDAAADEVEAKCAELEAE